MIKFFRIIRQKMLYFNVKEEIADVNAALERKCAEK
jgi:hypothetical protein